MGACECVKSDSGMCELTIAKVCHNVNAVFSRQHGEAALSWDDAPEWQRESAVVMVRRLLNERMTPEDLHNEWCKDKRKDGWTLGPTKDAVAKTHPCLIPYEELPTYQKTKDHLFLAVVTTLA